MVESDIPSPEVSGNTDPQKVYVYVIVAGDCRSKVGVANDVPQRLKGLQTAHYENLSVAYEFALNSRQEAYAVETRAHALLKASALAGEWFAITAHEAKVAVEQAISDLQDEHRRKDEVVRSRVMAVAKDVHVYLGPEITQAEPWIREPIDVMRFVLAQEGGAKREYLFNFSNCVVFVGCRKDEETGLHHFFMNDVSRWHMQEEDGSPYDVSGKANNNPLGTPPCAVFATVYSNLDQAA